MRRRYRWPEVLQPADAAAGALARCRDAARSRRQSPTVLRSLLCLHLAVSVQPDRHLAARHPASQRTEEGAKEAWLSPGVAGFAFRSCRGIRPRTGQADCQRTGEATGALAE